MQIRRWEETAVLCFPGSKNFLSAADAMGLMRNIFYSPSTNSAHNTERDISAPINMHMGRSPLEQHRDYCRDINLKNTDSTLLFGSVELCNYLRSTGIKKFNFLKRSMLQSTEQWTSESWCWSMCGLQM